MLLISISIKFSISKSNIGKAHINHLMVFIIVRNFSLYTSLINYLHTFT